MSPTNRLDSGYPRPQAVPCGVRSCPSASPLHTTRCMAYPAAYDAGTVPVFQPAIQLRSFGPLYQLVSILTGACLASALCRAVSASVPMPNRIFGPPAGTGWVAGGSDRLADG